MNFNSLTAQQKENVKNISYEYLLFKLVEWKCKNKNLTTRDEFNTKNDFTLTHLMVSPFFTCTANGSFDFLFDLFGEFYALNDGHNSMVAINYLLSGNNNVNFQYDKRKCQLQIINPSTTVNFLLEIDNSIKNTIVDVDNNYAFSDIQFTNTKTNIDKNIFSAIDTSIEALKKHTTETDMLGNKYGAFIDYTADDITTISMQHRSWAIMYDERSADLNELKLSKTLVERDTFVYEPFEELA